MILASLAADLVEKFIGNPENWPEVQALHATLQDVIEEANVLGTRTGQSGYGVGDRIFWEVVSKVQLQSRHLREAQIRLGYDPRGYGGPYIIDEKLVTKQHHKDWGYKFLYTFSCSASCD